MVVSYYFTSKQIPPFGFTELILVEMMRQVKPATQSTLSHLQFSGWGVTQRSGDHVPTHGECRANVADVGPAFTMCSAMFHLRWDEVSRAGFGSFQEYSETIPEWLHGVGSRMMMRKWEVHGSRRPVEPAHPPGTIPTGIPAPRDSSLGR